MKQLGKGPAEGVLPLVAEHHERDAGDGYPKGLKDPDLHLLSRVVAVAEVYAALTEKRSYRVVGFSPGEALEVLRRDGFDRTLTARQALCARCPAGLSFLAEGEGGGGREPA